MPQRQRPQQVLLLQVRKRQRQRHKAARDRCTTGAGVGLEHVAVQRDGAGRQRLEVHRRAQGPPDQPLDLLLAALAGPARSGERGAREHRVFGRDPSSGALPGEPVRDLVLHVCRAADPGVSAGDQDGAGRPLLEIGLDADRPHLVGQALMFSHGVFLSPEGMGGVAARRARGMARKNRHPARAPERSRIQSTGSATRPGTKY